MMKKAFLFFASMLFFCLCHSQTEKNYFPGKEHPDYIPFKKSEAEELLLKGNEFKYKKKLLEAEAYYKKSLNLEPNHPVTLLNLGNLYMESNKPKLAEECFLKILKVQPNNSMVYSNLSALKLDMEDNIAAIKYGKIGIEKSKTNRIKQQCYFNVSAGYSNLDSCLQAKKYFQQVIKFENGKIAGLYADYDTYLKKRCP